MTYARLIKPARYGKRRRAILPLLALSFVALLPQAGAAFQEQYEPPPLPVDPTPVIEMITAAERAELAKRQSDPRKLVEAFLEIAGDHLEAALAVIKNDDFRAAERELDIYNKSITEATKTASAQTDHRRKMGKKIEQAIYKHLKTLESIERYFPAERLPFAEFALKHAKQTRAQALNLTFDAGEIFKDPDGKDGKKSGARSRFAPPVPSVSPASSVSLASSVSPASLPRPARFTGEAQTVAHVALRRTSSAQLVDYLTEEEDDLVRQAQSPDLRTKVFMKIADRRLSAIVGVKLDPNDKKAQKRAEEEERLWGVLPKLDRLGYLRHYARAIDELMIKLEDAYERNPKAKAFEKAMQVLLESTDAQLATLKSLEPQLSGDAEKAAFRNAVEKAEVANQGARAKTKSN